MHSVRSSLGSSNNPIRAPNVGNAYHALTMRQFPRLSTEESKTCAACRKVVLRTQCHKNRYEEYICAPCAASGVKFTWRNRIRFRLGGVAVVVGAVTLATSLVLLLLWAFYSVVLHMDLFRMLRD